MRIPKRYGQSKACNCPFCERTATTKNGQDVPVCESHKKKNLENLKCACGDWLDVQSGKYGAYFRCMNCGNINFQKALEMNPQIEEEAKKEAARMQTRTVETRTERAAGTRFDQIKYQHKEPAQSTHPSNQHSSQKQASPRKETIIRSDDPDYFY